MSKFRPKNFQKKPQRVHNGPVTGTKVEVRHGDVNGAIRRLKKILENDNRQKELAKREFYEKPSVRRKRNNDTQKRRHQKDKMKQIISGEFPYQGPSDLKHMKSKRKRRKYADIKNQIALSRRKRGA